MRTDSLLGANVAPAPGRAVVVVIDEDEDTRLILAAWLGAAGMTVVCAPDPAAAARALEDRRPTVVVSELRGRGMSAPSLLGGIAAEPALRGVPLVVHTSRATAADRAEAARAGAAAFLTKPTALWTLLQAVWLLIPAPSAAPREDERELAPPPRHARDLDPPPVPFGDAARDREPEPGSRPM